MAAGRLFVPGYMPALDADGYPLVNARVYFYENETDVLATIYANEALTVPLANPVLASVAGAFPAIWASDAATYSYSIMADGGPAGIPFTGDGLSVSSGVAILVAAAAEAAADEAEYWAGISEDFAGASEDSAEESADILAQIEAIVSGSPDAPSVLNKLNLNGDNADATFLDNITFQTSLDGAADRPLRQKLEDELSIFDFEDDNGDPIDGLFSPINNALAAAAAQNKRLWIGLGDFVADVQHNINPIAPVDIPPLPNPSAIGAFAPAFGVVGESMIGTRIHNRVPNGFLFNMNVTNPASGAFRAQMGVRFENFTVIGLSSIPNSGAFRMFNGYQVQFDQIHIRNHTGTALKLVNGLEGDVPDSGWNCVSLRSLWIENCGLGGFGWGIDATGTEGRNEGSFTTLTNVFIQGCGKNQYFSITGLSTANPAIMTVNLNQMPAVSPTQTAHAFVFGDRVKSFGVRRVYSVGAGTLTADSLATTAGSQVVTMTLAAHGLAVGDIIELAGVAALGGITPTGVYQVTSIPGSGTFTFLNETAATSTVAAGGGGSIVLKTPMKAVDDVDFYVGPTVTATTLQLYSASGARVSLVTNPFATTLGSPTVTVTRAAHGLIVGDPVVFFFANEVNGIQVEKGYLVASVPDANTFTITATNNADATGSGGGTVAKYQKIATFNGASIGQWTPDLPTAAALANNPFRTIFTADDKRTVVVTHTAHGAVAGDLVTFAGATAVGGQTITGQYRVVGVGDETLPTPADQANKYRITMAADSTSAATGGGAGVTAQYTYRHTVHGEVGFYEPQSGGMRSKSQLVKLNSVGFTLNFNCAQYVQGGAGGAIGMYCEQVTWENNYRRHFFAKGGINYTFIGNQVHGNNQAGLRQWRLWEFDASEYTIQTIRFQNTKVRAKECPSIAFKYAGVQGNFNNIRVEATNWADYDYPGQSRFIGVPFDQITQNLILTYSSPTAMILRPDQFAGGGNTTPLRLRGPVNDAGTGVPSTTGEWIEWKLSSNNGLTLSNAGLPASAVLYYVYGYDNDGVMALTTSTVAPVTDVTHGYQTLPGDPTMLFVGEAQTDGAGQFTTTGHGFLQPRRIGGAQSGTQAWEWDDWVLERTVKRSGARPTSATQSTQVIPWLKLASKSHDFADLAAGATETTTLTSGVTCALGDTVVKAYLSINQQTVVLHAFVSAANTITVIAQNIGAANVNLANATLSVVYYRNS